MIGPWTNGVTQIIYEGGFGASAWYEIIEKYKVDVWYTAPTAIRLLMRAGEDVVNKYDLTSLRFIGSVGEPLNPEAVVWGNRNYKMPT
jgi:acetyl-CoA synthetase